MRTEWLIKKTRIRYRYRQMGLDRYIFEWTTRDTDRE